MFCSGVKKLRKGVYVFANIRKKIYNKKQTATFLQKRQFFLHLSGLFEREGVDYGGAGQCGREDDGVVAGCKFPQWQLVFAVVGGCRLECDGRQKHEIILLVDDGI